MLSDFYPFTNQQEKDSQINADLNALSGHKAYFSLVDKIYNLDYGLRLVYL